MDNNRKNAHQTIQELGKTAVGEWLNDSNEHSKEILFPQEYINSSSFINKRNIRLVIEILQNMHQSEKTYNRSIFLKNLIDSTIEFNGGIYIELYSELYGAFQRWNKSDDRAQTIAKEIDSEVMPFITNDDDDKKIRARSIKLMWQLIGSPRKHIYGFQMLNKTKNVDVMKYSEGADYILSIMQENLEKDIHSLSDEGKKVVTNLSSAFFILALMEESYIELTQQYSFGEINALSDINITPEDLHKSFYRKLSEHFPKDLES